MDCNTPDKALETFVRIYETFLLNKNGITQKLEDQELEAKVEYKLEDILKFIDQLFDLGVMVFNDKASGYTAHGKAWVKAKIHSYMRRLAE